MCPGLLPIGSQSGVLVCDHAAPNDSLLAVGAALWIRHETASLHGGKLSRLQPFDFAWAGRLVVYRLRLLLFSKPINVYEARGGIEWLLKVEKSLN